MAVGLAMSPTLPRLNTLDSTSDLLREGYLFIGSRCDALGTDGFFCRLMLKQACCLRGPDAASAFYAPDRFTRRGAMPLTAQTLLQDKGSVQALDGAPQRLRKAMFLSLMTPESLGRAASLFAEEWAHAVSAQREIVLLDASALMLGRTALRWCGLAGELQNAERLTRDCCAMVVGAGRIGWKQIKGQLHRRSGEAWARSVIRRLRKAAPDGTPASVIAHAEDEGGTALSVKTAGVELINLIRPMVAVSRFVVFAAHALHQHPEWRSVLADSVMRRAFAQEVRRFYPFIPLMAGRVLQPFIHNQTPFARGDWVLLDIHGTNRHASWGDPHQFRPQRFLEDPRAEAMIVAHGSGNPATGHRCPGEDITLALLTTAVRLLSTMRYAVPTQDLTIPLNVMPTAPVSGFRMRM